MKRKSTFSILFLLLTLSSFHGWSQRFLSIGTGAGYTLRSVDGDLFNYYGEPSPLRYDVRQPTFDLGLALGATSSPHIQWQLGLLYQYASPVWGFRNAYQSQDVQLQLRTHELLLQPTLRLGAFAGKWKPYIGLAPTLGLAIKSDYRARLSTSGPWEPTEDEYDLPYFVAGMRLASGFGLPVDKHVLRLEAYADGKAYFFARRQLGAGLRLSMDLAY